MPKSFQKLAFILLIALLFASCSAPPANNTAANTAFAIEPKTDGIRGGKLTTRFTAAPKTFNYILAADEPTIAASLYMLTSRLVEFDHRTQKFIPGLAESLKASPDGTTVDVKLREGLKFSDGNDLTTDDVIFTLNAIYDERTKSPAFKDAMMVDGKMITTKKVNEREMQFIFPKPVANPDPYLVNLGVLPSHTLEQDMKAGKLAESWKIDAPPASMVSSGPFIVETSVPGERIDFARNPHYWEKDSKGTQLPYIDKYSIEVIADANNTFVRLQQGSLDLADRIRPTDYIELTKTPGPTRAVDVGPGLGIDHLWFSLNTTDGNGAPIANQTKRTWFTDKRFRQAVAMAVDRETIAKITLQGMASPLHGFVSPANKAWISKDIAKIDYNIAKAEELLKEAGFKKGGTAESPTLTDANGNAVQFTLIVPAENEPRKLTAAVVQQDLAKLGIKMDVVPLEIAGLNERWTKSYDYDAILLGLSQTDVEPSSYASFVMSSGSAHQWQPKQKTPATEWEGRVDKLFAEMSVELDPQKRMIAFNEIQRIYREEMPVVPLTARHIVSAAGTKIGNYAPSSIFPYSLWNIDELFLKQ